jgi:hypothetical protein
MLIPFKAAHHPGRTRSILAPKCLRKGLVAYPLLNVAA